MRSSYRERDFSFGQEHCVLALVAKGWRNATIAHELFISTRTVEAHLYHIFDKIGVSSRTEAALFALQSTSLLNTKISGTSHDKHDNNSYAKGIS